VSSEELIEVRLLGLPIDVQRRTNAHYDALFREFELIRQSDRAAETLPVRLLNLIDELTARFQQFGEQPRAVLEEARERGGTAVDLMYEVPPQIVDACQQLMASLDEADEYCAAGEHLVTLQSPPIVRTYRIWFLQEFVEQASGRPPSPWHGPTSGDGGLVGAGQPASNQPHEPAAAGTSTSRSADGEHAGTDEVQWPTAIDGDAATVALSGELDLGLAPSLRDHLNELHNDGVRQFTLDASEVTFIDSVGLSVLLALYRRCREEDGRVSLVNPPPPIRRTLEISGLLEVLDVN
jgi:anti-anti-sigma factor